jgi:hypothetical protein
VARQPRIHNDFESFRDAVIKNVRIEDVIDEIETVRELHFVVECYENMCDLENICEESDDEPLYNIDFIANYPNNIYEDMYDYLQTYMDKKPNDFMDYSELVETWLSDNQLST